MATTAPQDDFKEAVKAYIDLHDQLTRAAKDLRGIRKKKAELADVIVQYMKKNDIDECALRDGKLIRKSAKRLEPLKKEHIMDELRATLGEARAEQCLVNIFGKRAVAERDTLRRTKKRGGGGDDDGAAD